jgi:ABC-type oligopeptide transport system substrate-binding subunit
VHLRRALSHLVDRRALVEDVLGVGMDPLAAVMPARVGGQSYALPPFPDFDPQAGRRALAAAGFPGGAALPELRYGHLPVAAHDVVATALVDGWRREGVPRVLPLAREWRTLLAAVEAGDLELAALPWCAEVPDPAAFLVPYTSDSPDNRGGFRDPAFDALYAEIVAAPAGPVRTERVEAALRRLAELTPVLPMFHVKRVYLVREFVHGIGPCPLGVHLLRYVSVGPAAAAAGAGG